MFWRVQPPPLVVGSVCWVFCLEAGWSPAQLAVWFGTVQALWPACGAECQPLAGCLWVSSCQPRGSPIPRALGLSFLSASPPKARDCPRPYTGALPLGWGILEVGTQTAGFSDFQQTLNQPLTVTAPFSHQAETFKSGWVGSLDRRPSTGPCAAGSRPPLSSGRQGTQFQALVRGWEECGQTGRGGARLAGRGVWGHSASLP